MLAIERAFAANRQADAMNRQRVMFADQAQIVMERAAGDHVVFGMHLKEPDIRAGLEYIHKVLGLEPQPRTWRELGRTRRDERSKRAVHYQRSAG